MLLTGFVVVRESANISPLLPLSSSSFHICEYHNNVSEPHFVLFSTMVVQNAQEVYLALASTCKLYHNRLNNSAVWLNVLQNKWDLDVTCLYVAPAETLSPPSFQLSCVNRFHFPSWANDPLLTQFLTSSLLKQ